MNDNERRIVRIDVKDLSPGAAQLIMRRSGAMTEFSSATSDPQGDEQALPPLGEGAITAVPDFERTEAPVVEAPTVITGLPEDLR